MRAATGSASPARRMPVKLRSTGISRMTSAVTSIADTDRLLVRVCLGPCVDGSGLARRIFTSQGWSVQPCVRPLRAVHMTAGHNALRGSGPAQKLAFENALAQVGCPDRRIDRLCITCCSPTQPSHHASVLGAISSDPQPGRIIVSLAPSHHCPGHSRKLVGKRDGSNFGRPSCQQRCDPRSILGAMELGIADDGQCASHKQAAQIPVSLFADTAEPVPTPARVLSGYKRQK